MRCDTPCRFYVAPAPMAPEAERIALSRGVNRQGACHRYPRAERVAAEHWCGEFRKGEKPAEPPPAAEGEQPA